jgi:hypothetical protein
MSGGANRFVAAAAVVVSGVLLSQCGRSELSSPTRPAAVAPAPGSSAAITGSDQPQLGQFAVCKTGNTDGTFTVDANPPGGATMIVTSPIVIATGTCQVVAVNETLAGASITVTETSAGLVSIAGFRNDAGAISPDNPVNGPVTRFVNEFHGFVFTFDNFLETPNEPPGGDEGCTPGYWRNHPSQWAVYAPGADFDTTFGVNFFTPDKTLWQTVRFGGGGSAALARHGVAGLLSAASSGVDYAYTEAQVIDIVQGDGAYAGMSVTERTNLLVSANEAGCPLG